MKSMMRILSCLFNFSHELIKFYYKICVICALKEIMKWTKHLNISKRGLNYGQLETWPEYHNQTCTHSLLIWWTRSRRFHHDILNHEDDSGQSTVHVYGYHFMPKREDFNIKKKFVPLKDKTTILGKPMTLIMFLVESWHASQNIAIYLTSFHEKYYRLLWNCLHNYVLDCFSCNFIKINLVGSFFVIFIH